MPTPCQTYPCNFVGFCPNPTFCVHLVPACKQLLTGRANLSDLHTWVCNVQWNNLGLSRRIMHRTGKPISLSAQVYKIAWFYFCCAENTHASDVGIARQQGKGWRCISWRHISRFATNTNTLIKTGVSAFTPYVDIAPVYPSHCKI